MNNAEHVCVCLYFTVVFYFTCSTSTSITRSKKMFSKTTFFFYLLLVWLNKTKVYNGHILRNALDNKPAAIPILTVSNHHSCFDDPGIWGEFKLSMNRND